ncbi:helix-turn-helix transcriptional regulator [Roseibium sp. SCP14]|uniref:helix-turn-helix transcriptional regulator n=1 Tax=Roseibium sp. SCP14 TaxID=3141375 RepID=UPI003336B56A
MIRRSILSSISVDTTQLPDKDQFAFWRDGMFSATGMTTERDGPSDAPFNCKLQHYRTNQLAISRRQCSSPCVVKRTEKGIAQADMDVVGICYRTQGDDLAGDYGPGIQLIRSGDLRTFDLQYPYWYAHDGYVVYSMLLSRNWVVNETHYREFPHGLVLRDSLLSQVLKTTMCSAFDALKTASVSEFEAISTALNRFALDAIRFQEIGDLDTEEISSRSIRQLVLNHIERHYADPRLTPEKIALSVGISRTKLFQVCRPMGTPRTIIRNIRLKKAADRLRRGSGENLSRLAHEVGISGRQTLTRLFREEFGLSPKEYRQEAHAQSASIAETAVPDREIWNSLRTSFRSSLLL